MAREAKPLRVDFGRPSRGWMRMTLQASSIEFASELSWISDDFLIALVTGLLTLWRKSTELTLCWNTEPTEFELRIAPASDNEVTLDAFRFVTARRSAKDQVFSAQGDRRAVVLVFWRTLRELESQLTSEDIARDWPRFPTRELALLTREIRASRAARA